MCVPAPRPESILEVLKSFDARVRRFLYGLADLSPFPKLAVAVEQDLDLRVLAPRDKIAYGPILIIDMYRVRGLVEGDDLMWVS
jgi:hypothetical protein